jgi:hypothetical protein
MSNGRKNSPNHLTLLQHPTLWQRPTFLGATMPVAPLNPYWKSTCAVCGWSALTKQRSDVLRVPHKCKKCGNEKLQLSNANFFEVAIQKPIDTIKNFLLKTWTRNILDILD